jgi:predicted dehydrogenase
MGPPVTLAVVGTGSRGCTYSAFAERYPERARVVAVADPRVERRDALADRLGVPVGRRFDDWRALAGRDRLADAVVVTTPDREHVGPACRFAEMGYHVLLEKPIAPSRDECLAVIEAVERAGVIFAVCHVMRYTAYTEAVRRVIAEGRLGQLVGVDQLEQVGWWHFAHSYVRGNWRRTDQAGPSVLTKCCHDLDWLRYVVGQPARTVSSQGGLHHFTPANRPTGAAERCLDCAVEPDCPYSAVRLYRGCLGDPQSERWPLSVLTTDLTERGVHRALREGPYGRCVYACDNDVADHQVITIEFEGGVLATLTMSAFTPFGRRQTRIMGTGGILEGDGERFTVTDFITGRVESVDLSASAAAADDADSHDGGDFGVVGAFVDAVANADPSLIRSGPRESVESHLMAFAAERSRQTGVPAFVNALP